jgi:hypothetical protein
MAWPPVLGKLWVSLKPTNQELIVTGSRHKYQQFVIFKFIQEFGINTQVYIQHETLTGAHGCVSIVSRMLHQCVHLGYNSDFLLIKDTEEITMPWPFGYSWTDVSTIHTVTTTIRREDLNDTECY